MNPTSSSSSSNWRKAAIGSNQRICRRLVLVPGGTSLLQPNAFWWIQAPTQQPPDCRNGIFFPIWLSNSKLSAHLNVSLQSFLGWYHRLRPQHLSFHCLDAETTNPPAMELLPGSQNVCRGAILREAAGVAFGSLNFELGRRFGGRRGRWGFRGRINNCHGRRFKVIGEGALFCQSVGLYIYIYIYIH